MAHLNISVDAREDVGRGANRRLRGLGRVPGVIYSKGGSRPVSVDTKELEKLWGDLIGHTPLVVINEGKGETRALIQDVQRDPIKDSFIHIDFFEVTAGEAITSKAALHTKGEPYGVRTEGGNLEVHLHEIEIRSRPSDIPDFIEVDVSAMKVGDSVHIGDLPKFEGVEYLQNEETIVISVAGVKVEALPEEVEAAEAEEAAAEAEIESEDSSEKEES